jgi:hypothetical protein
MKVSLDRLKSILALAKTISVYGTLAILIGFLAYVFLDVQISVHLTNHTQRHQRVSAVLNLVPHYCTDWEKRECLIQAANHTANKHNLDPALFRALIAQESAWNKEATSSVGARGLTQLMPATASGECGLGEADITDPLENLNCGAYYLAKQLRRFGDVELALAAYNSGPERVAKLGRVPRITETQNYVSRIMAGWDQPL